MATTTEILRTIDDLDGAWLEAALGRTGLELTGTQPIGTGQMSQNHRVSFTADGQPESVVVKLASDDPTSRATGVNLGAYKREVTFYRELADRMGSSVPACHLAEYDPVDGWFTLLLEDVVGAEQGDQIAGCSIDQTRAIVQELARLHAPVLGDLAVGSQPFLNEPDPLTQQLMQAVLPGFLERYADRVSPEHREVAERFAAVTDAWLADARPPFGLVHGDYRLDNLLLSPDGGIKVVDWQTVSWGPAMTDVAYVVAGCLQPEERKAGEEGLVRDYHAELVANGATAMDLETAWDGYRRTSFYGIRMAIVASMVVVRTDRGDDMFMTSFARGAQQILDVGALDLLPEPSAAPPVALQPEPSDEGLHAPGAEELWNESWYFDAVSDDGSLGIYARLGRLPNRDECMYMACITGPGRDPLILCDAYPLPATDDSAQTIDVEGLHAEQHCEDPLRAFRLVMHGVAQAFDDPAAPLRLETGTPTPIALDVRWTTTGVPYQWRQSTRYEIPCRVEGTVTIDGVEHAFAGPGQRDHSWGARDWWAVEWMWNGLHLDDGTHVHQVAVPMMPGYGVGYEQRDGEVVEVAGLTLETDVADDGLPTRSRTVSTPSGLDLTIEPIAFAAVRMDAPDGRISRFPRAMVRVTAADGRSGTGWIEWNMIERP